MRSKVEIEIENIQNFLKSMANDIETMEKVRRAVALQCLFEVTPPKKEG